MHAKRLSNLPASVETLHFPENVQRLYCCKRRKVQEWKDKLLAALKQQAKVIIDFIPELELIVGKQPEVPHLGPTEAQNRFNLVFKEFIRVFTQKEHPLVIFLDALQWADSASLKLMQSSIADVVSQYLLIIGA